jgi:hypothetical protein
MTSHVLEIQKEEGAKSSIYRAACSCGWMGPDHIAKASSIDHNFARFTCQQDFDRHLAGDLEPHSVPEGEERVWGE